MFTYSYNKSINVPTLFDQLHATLPGLRILSIDTIDSTHYNIVVPAELSAQDKDDLDALVDAHSSAPDMVKLVASRIILARSFGVQIIATYGAQNTLAGYSVTQIQDIMERTAKVQAALSTGSLYVAIRELNNVELDDHIITTTKITQVRNQIEDYLGIPRT